MNNNRTLVLLDVENLMGGADPHEAVSQKAIELIESFRDERTHVVVAASHRVAAWLPWRLPWVRWKWRSGPDGADLCLLAVIDHERVDERFGRLVLVSGDGIFALPVAQLAASAVHTTVIARSESLSRRLRMAAHSVVAFDSNDEVSRDAA